MFQCFYTSLKYIYTIPPTPCCVTDTRHKLKGRVLPAKLGAFEGLSLACFEVLAREPGPEKAMGGSEPEWDEDEEEASVC